MPSTAEIEKVVLEAINVINMGREEDAQLEVGPSAPIFGDGSPLDSMGLVALLMEVEESCRDEGWEVTLNDERAMSQRRNPFRDVPSLVSFIAERLEEQSA